MLKRDDPVPGLKRQLAAEVANSTRGWSLLEVAWRTDETVSRVSRVRSGKLDGVSLEALVRMLSRLGKEAIVRVVVDPGVR